MAQIGIKSAPLDKEMRSELKRRSETNWALVLEQKGVGHNYDTKYVASNCVLRTILHKCISVIIKFLF